MISTTTSSPDRYKWKLAGDTAFQAERDVKTGADLSTMQEICLANALTSVTVPATCNSGLGVPATGDAQNTQWRVYAALAQDDPAHREINRVRCVFGSVLSGF